MMKIALLEALGIPASLLEELEAPFKAEGHTFVHYDRTTDVDTLCGETKDVDAVILANMPFPAAAIECADQLKFIDIAFTGVDHVAMSVAREKGITASNASGYSNEAVPELGIGMALMLLRNIPQVEQRCREGGTKVGLVGGELKGRTVGIIGLGNLGRRAAELYNAFGCRVLASSRTIHPDCPAYVTEVPMEQLLRESDIVQLHCPLNASTRGLINAEKLAMMKPSAYLINLARGPVVNAQDLADALNNDVIAGAGVDVFDVEPPLPASEPLLQAKHTVLTPHVAFATGESMKLRAEIVFDNLRAWLDGAPKNLV